MLERGLGGKIPVLRYHQITSSMSSDSIKVYNQVKSYHSTGVIVTKYIWQNPSWPKFHWDEKKVSKAFNNAIKSQAFILGNAHFFDIKEEAKIFKFKAD